MRVTITDENGAVLRMVTFKGGRMVLEVDDAPRSARACPRAILTIKGPMSEDVEAQGRLGHPALPPVEYLLNRIELACDACPPGVETGPLVRAHVAEIRKALRRGVLRPGEDR
jgi:hypothetical protein